MNRILRPVASGVWLVSMLCVAEAPEAPFGLGFVHEAEAGIIVAPVRRTAVAVTAVSASSSANAAAAANANAAAAKAAAPPPAPAGPMPPGTMVTTLPPGCVPTKLNGVEYQRCGSTYYRATMQGSTLVFVVAQP